jgi:fumarate hydratase, class II
MTPLLRTEEDSLGSIELPADALYGACTQRAVLNFPISGNRFGREFLRALGLIKWAAAEANQRLGRLDAARGQLIAAAAREMADGKLDAHFPVDVYQTGSGTSTHMNANEVIANRCAQLAGKPVGKKDPVHPNDHVNLGQSSNDVFPSALHLAAGTVISHKLLPALEKLQAALERKSREFWPVIKIGRTHLMDATPVRLGQEFGGYARQLAEAHRRATQALQCLLELPLGGTAVGTGLNGHPDFAKIALELLRAETGIEWREATHPFEAQSARDATVEASGHLKTIAISLFKIANDLRWMASGPRCGLGEIRLPSLQPGSSMMPGKINPVLCETLMQVCARVVGNDATVTWAAAQGNFELNAMTPVLADALLESLRILSHAAEVFCEKCVQGIAADPARCAQELEASMALVTSLVPWIGYDQAAAVAMECARTGQTVRETCRRLAILPEQTLQQALSPATMCGPAEAPPPPPND